jgi:hypothetical protein
MQTIGWFQGNTWNCLGSNPLGCLPFAVVKKTASWPGMSDTDVWRHVSPGEGWVLLALRQVQDMLVESCSHQC